MADTGIREDETPDEGTASDMASPRSTARSSSRSSVASPTEGWWLQRQILRFVHFLREIVAELRKVIYPSRQQLLTYTVVVLFFVSFMTALVAGLDYGLTKAVVALFS